MTTMQQVMVGIFRDHAPAEQAINELLQAGFDHHQIRFAGRETSTGGILEKIKSLFTGQDIAAGGIYDDLVKMGVPPEDARHYQSEFEAGRAIVAVQANGRMQEVSNILVRYGGYGINQRSAQSANYGVATGIQEPTTEDEQPTKPRKEEPGVRKQPVETGKTRPPKEVAAEQKGMEVPVTRQEAYTERRPGPGQPSDQPIGAGETYRTPVYEEQVTTEKRPREREEASFGKRPAQETPQVTDTTQQEEPHVEYTGGANVQNRGFRRATEIEQDRDFGRDRGMEQGTDIEQGRDIKRDRGMEQGREYGEDF